MPLRPDHALGKATLHLLHRYSRGLLPLRRHLKIRTLEIERVIEMFILMHFAIVDVQSGEKDAARSRGGKRERHRMNIVTALPEFENSEAKRSVSGQF